MRSFVLTLSRLLAIAVLCVGVSAQKGVSDAVRTRTVGVVLRSAASAELDANAFGSRLDDVASNGLPVLFEILGQRGVPSQWNPEIGRFVALDSARLEEISDAIVRLTPPKLRTFFERVAAEEPRIRFRALAADLIGRFGDSNDIRLLMQVARPLESDVQVLPRVSRDSFEDALASILRGDQIGFIRVQELFVNLHIGLESSVVDAVARVPSERALETLARIVGRRIGLDAHTLTAIARIADDVPHPVDPKTTVIVREQLAHVDASAMRTAIRACGRLEDFEAIPLLIEKLADPDKSVGACAHRALQDLTRLRFRHDLAVWQNWYSRERLWWDELQPGLAIDLARGDESEATKAVMSMAGRRVDRHRLARLLENALYREENSVVRLTCQALGQLASPVAVPALIEALEHRSGQVRDAAWEALKTITGFSLPLDPAVWRSTV